MRRDRWILAGVIGLAAARAAADGLSLAYLDLLERYARGERAAAVSALGSWKEEDLERQLGAVRAEVRAAERCPTCPSVLDTVPLRAAVMLHADRDEAERPTWTGVEQPRPCPGPHAKLAQHYAELLALRPATRDFARRFFLAMAMRSQWDCCLADARAWALVGIKRFPRDAELLLTAGGAEEEAATLLDDSYLRAGDGRRDQVFPAGTRAQLFQEARRSFTEAVAAAPDLVVAQIRLGRVLWRVGQSDAARTRLEDAIGHTRDPGLLYLAHLFLGRVHEDADRLEPALREYRLALEADPRSQAAAVALSHALRIAGDAEGSRRALTTAMSMTGRRGRDAYWEYLMGNAVDTEDRFAELRRETLR